MDKLRLMQTFIAIVDAGSLTAAAESLGTSLSAVVRALAAQEEHLGVRLINRSTRRMALTGEGRVFAEHCRRLLAGVLEAEAAVSQQPGHPAGLLSITAPSLFGRLHLAPLVADFLQAYPEMRIQMVLLDRVVDMLEEGIDLALRIGQLPDSALVARPLGHTGRVVCASPDYLAQHGTPQHPQELAQHRCIRFIGIPGGEQWAFVDQGAPLAVPVAGVLITNQLDAAREACLRGVGCGRFFRYQVEDALRAGQLVALLEAFAVAPSPIQFVYPHSRLLSQRVRTFMDWAEPRLRERLAEPAGT